MLTAIFSLGRFGRFFRIKALAPSNIKANIVNKLCSENLLL